MIIKFLIDAQIIAANATGVIHQQSTTTKDQKESLIPIPSNKIKNK